MGIMTTRACVRFLQFVDCFSVCASTYVVPTYIGESMHLLVQRKSISSSLKLRMDPCFPVCAPAHHNHVGCDCAEENDRMVVPEVTTLDAFRYIGEEPDIWCDPAFQY